MLPLVQSALAQPSLPSNPSFYHTTEIYKINVNIIKVVSAACQNYVQKTQSWFRATATARAYCESLFHPIQERKFQLLQDPQAAFDINTKYNQQPEIRNRKSRYKEMEGISGKKVEWAQNSSHLFTKHIYTEKGVEMVLLYKQTNAQAFQICQSYSSFKALAIFVESILRQLF